MGRPWLQGKLKIDPRFIFGVEGNMVDNLYLLEDNKLVYTAGHNVIVYSTDDKS
jgi:hypothetical protein